MQGIEKGETVMKIPYAELEIEILEFLTEDVITSSPDYNDPNEIPEGF